MLCKASPGAGLMLGSVGTMEDHGFYSTATLCCVVLGPY